MNLDNDYKEKIDNFVSEVEYLLNYAFDLGINLSLGWKYHILKYHLSDFLDRHNKPLGIFSEQTCESVHKNINETLKRCSVSQNHADHKEKLRKMSVNYSSMRI